MKSPMEVMVGRAHSDWRARERWGIRAGLGAFGFLSFYSLRWMLVLLHGPYGAPIAALYYFWAILCILALLVLSERRIRPTPPPPG